MAAPERLARARLILEKGIVMQNSAESDASGAARIEDLLGLFDKLQAEVFAYQYAQQVISYDGETVGPLDGVPARGEALAVLAQKEHEAAYGDRAGALIAALEPHLAELDEMHVDELRVFARNYREMGSVPAQECADFARLTSAANSVWKQAKATNDYAVFEPYLEDIVASLKRQAGYLNPDADPYEVWLYRFERGLTRASLDEFFGQVRSAVVPLVEQIARRGIQPEDSFVHVPVSAPVQKRICDEVARIMGLAASALAIGDSEHPFTDGFSHGDVRITNHIHEDNLPSALFSLIHEGGHALYEQGIDPRYDYTCLRGGVSMGIHESQSRFMENVIARSEAFCGLILPVLKSFVPEAYAAVDAGMLYRALCRSEPSLIRTEADELTYPLHIMVRYQIESALFSGEVTVHDAPEMWNALMKEYLGVDVPDDSHGILQDTHWSNGTFAYFPSYAIGSAYAAQYLRAMEGSFDVFGSVARGELGRVRSWLGERIWRFGSAKDPAWLVRNACGEAFDPKCYIDYLTGKYRALYSL